MPWHVVSVRSRKYPAECPGNLARSTCDSLPGKIVGISDTAVHALARKWRTQMGSITEKKNPAAAPTFCGAGLKSVYLSADDIR